MKTSTLPRKSNAALKSWYELNPFPSCFFFPRPPNFRPALVVSSPKTRYINRAAHQGPLPSNPCTETPSPLSPYPLWFAHTRSKARASLNAGTTCCIACTESRYDFGMNEVSRAVLYNGEGTFVEFSNDEVDGDSCIIRILECAGDNRWWGIGESVEETVGIMYIRAFNRVKSVGDSSVFGCIVSKIKKSTGSGYTPALGSKTNFVKRGSSFVEIYDTSTFNPLLGLAIAAAIVAR